MANSIKLKYLKLVCDSEAGNRMRVPQVRNARKQTIIREHAVVPRL